MWFVVSMKSRLKFWLRYLFVEELLIVLVVASIVRKIEHRIPFEQTHILSVNVHKLVILTTLDHCRNAHYMTE